MSNGVCDSIFEVDLEGEDVLKKTVGEEEDNKESSRFPPSVIFYVKLFDPTPQGVKISKKNVCMVEIIPEEMELEEDVADQERLIEFFVEQNDETWAYQFKKAIILQPTINENDEVDYVTGSEAFMHFAALGWKVFFALIPPARFGGGWVAFVSSLFMIGFVTAIVGEVANLFGCAIGLQQSVTAITFVALGTSLPDTFASMTAAQEADSADAAVGNVTGSNSVNVFLGLGLPWLIGAIYDKGEYVVPSGDLGFSVLIFMITATACIILLLVRRKVSFFSFFRSLEESSEAQKLER